VKITQGMCKTNKHFIGKILLVCLVLLINVNKSEAQTPIYTQETFVSQIPFNTASYNRRNCTADWLQYKLSGNHGLPNSFEWINNGTYPTAINQNIVGFSTGAGFVRAINRTVALPAISGAESGDAAILISRSLDFSGHTTFDALRDTIGISMFRDGDGSALQADSVQVYLNTSPQLTGATLLQVACINSNPVGSGITAINRSAFLAPLAFVQSNSWNRFTFGIPNLSDYVSATGGYSAVYLIVAVYSAAGNNIYLDNFNLPQWPTNMVIQSAELTYQENADVGKNTSNNLLANVRIKTRGSLLPLRLDGLTFSTTGSTNFSNDAQNPIAYFTAGTPVFSNTIATGVVAMPTNATVIPNAQGLLNYGWYASGCLAPATPVTMTLNPGTENYAWLACDIKPGPPAISNNRIGVAFQFAIARPAAVCTFYGQSNSSTNLAVTSVPPQTLGNSRIIDQSYAMPGYMQGTAFAGYNNNDYISAVQLTGENGTQIQNYDHDQPCAACTVTALNPLLCNRLACHPPDFTAFKPENKSSFQNRTVQLQLGKGVRNGTAPYNLFVQAGAWPFANNSMAVFIDWNRDGDFDDTYNGPGGVIAETYGTHQLPAGDLNNYPVSSWPLGTQWSIDVPDKTDLVYDNNDVTQLPNNSSSSIFTGNVRMRVREVYGASNVHPFSNNYAFGEIEDYYIQVLDNCPDMSSNVCKWIGTTADWNTATNWCPALPTANDIAYIGPVSTSFFNPVIGDSTQAVCRALHITDGAKLTADAPTGTSSLKIRDDLIIGFNAPSSSNASFNVKSKLEGLITLPGMQSTPPAGIAVPAITPFKQNAHAKLQVAYTKAELIRTFGLKAGDVIDTLFTLSKDVLSPLPPFQTTLQNFRIIAYHVAAPVTYTFPVPAAGTKMAVDENDANVNSWQTIFGPATVTLSSTTGSNGVAPGNVDTFALIPNSFVWDGLSNLVLSFEYKITSGAVPAKQFVLYDENNTDYTTLSLTNDAIGNTITGWNVAGPNTYYNGSSYINNGAAPLPQLIVATQVSRLRPRISFKFRRPYKSFLINIGGDIINNNSYMRSMPHGITPAYNIAGDSGFVAGLSTVVFNNAGRNTVNSPGLNNTNAAYYFGIPGQNLATDVDQEITSDNTAATLFNYLEIDKPTLKVIRQNAAVTNIVGGGADSVFLLNGSFELNRRSFTIFNGDSSSLRFANGYFTAEDNVGANAGTMESIVHWQIGNKAGTHIFPFAKNGNRFNFTYSNGTGDDVGLLSVSTYGTPSNNTTYPYPFLPGSNTLHVGSMTTNSLANATPWTVDRFWLIRRSTTAVLSNQATMQFQYPNTEGTGEMKAQRYGFAGGSYNAWESPFAGQSDFSSGGLVTVNVPGMYAHHQNNIWTIVHINAIQNPLPVNLISFTAKLIEKKVHLNWTVAQEQLIAKYQINRTADFNFYENVKQQIAFGNAFTTSYQAVDPMPLPGTSYYQLAIENNDGTINYSNAIAIYNNLKEFSWLQVNANDASVNIAFQYFTGAKLTCTISDVIGNEIYKQTINAIAGKQDAIIPANLSSGIYHICLFDNAQRIATKFIKP